jgi:hypothetical protein
LTSTVEIKDRLLLTLEEAAQYTGIGQKLLRELSYDSDFGEIVVEVGRRRMFKRELLRDYINDTFAGC